MSSSGHAPRRRWLRAGLLGVGLVATAAALFWSGVALETYVLSQRIPLLARAKHLRLGMTWKEVEDHFAVKPEERKAPEIGRFVTPDLHEGVKRYTESRDDGPRGNTYAGLTVWLSSTGRHGPPPSGRHLAETVLEILMAFCPKCTKPVDARATACPHCGYDFPPSPPAPARPNWFAVLFGLLWATGGLVGLTTEPSGVARGWAVVLALAAGVAVLITGLGPLLGPAAARWAGGVTAVCLAVAAVAATADLYHRGWGSRGWVWLAAMIVAGVTGLTWHTCQREPRPGASGPDT